MRTLLENIVVSLLETHELDLEKPEDLYVLLDKAQKAMGERNIQWSEAAFLQVVKPLVDRHKTRIVEGVSLS